MFFFFQAEDGIRDYKVTGVQTCALPIASQAGGRSQGSQRLYPSTDGRYAWCVSRDSDQWYRRAKGGQPDKGRPQTDYITKPRRTSKDGDHLTTSLPREPDRE